MDNPEHKDAAVKSNGSNKKGDKVNKDSVHIENIHINKNDSHAYDNHAYENKDGIKPKHTPDPTVVFEVQSSRRKIHLICVGILIFLLAAALVGILLYFLHFNEEQSGKQDKQRQTSRTEFLPFGPTNGDQEMMKTELKMVEITLTQPVPIFSKLKKSFYLFKNGYLATTKDVDPDNLLSKESVLAIYAMEMSIIDQQSKIYYRVIKDANTLENVNRDLSNLLGKTFVGNFSFVTTYVNLSSFTQAKSRHSFQLVLTSDGYLTYAMLHYRQLDSNSGLFGYYESDCNQAIYKAKTNHKSLVETSNVGVPGIHIYLLTNYSCKKESCEIFHCSPKLQCMYTNSGQPYCGCIKECAQPEEDSGQEVCATDNKTYPTICDLNKHLCETYGNNTEKWQVFVSHKQRCEPCRDFVCPDHLQCKVDNTTTQKIAYCDCIENCPNSSNETEQFCGTDYKVYKSFCFLNKSFCDKYGASAKVNVSLLYNGDCKVFYPFGPEQEDMIFPKNMTGITLVLKKPMPLLSYMGQKLMIFKNGFVKTVTRDKYGEIESTIAIARLLGEGYFDDTTGGIYYRETTKEHLLKLMTHDVQLSGVSSFEASYAVIITFNVTDGESANPYKFQLILVAGKTNETFGIFNYAGNYGGGYFEETTCNFNSMNPYKFLGFTSNINFPGRHVLKLTNKKYVRHCAPHLECHKSNDESYCSCKQCEIDENINVCANNGVTYESICELQKAFCEKYGNQTEMNITVLYNGRCEEPFPYGADDEIKYQTNMIHFKLNKSMPIFSDMKSDLYIHTNGYISITNEVIKNLTIPSDIPLIAGYFLPIDETLNISTIIARDSIVKDEFADRIYIKEVFDIETLKKVNGIVDERFQRGYHAKHAVIITYVNQTDRQYRNSYQMTIASDYKETFLIYHFMKLESNGAIVGFSETNCNSLLLISPWESRQLTHKGNTATNGRHVYKLNPEQVQCSKHTECERQSSNDTLACKCKSVCEKEDESVCGSDNVSYTSLCEMEKRFCQKYGAIADVNVTVIHKGLCNSLYPFGKDDGDEGFPPNKTEVMFHLKKFYPLFTKNRNRMMIKRSGQIFIDPYGDDFDKQEISLVGDQKLCTGIGYVYYRESNSTSLIQRVSNDLLHSEKNETVVIENVIVITYKDVKFCFSNVTQTFQVTFASNLNRTYVLLNYRTTETNHAYIYESRCNFQNITSSSLLMYNSNFNHTGRYVYLMSRYAQVPICPRHLECMKNSSLSTCSCISDCSHVPKKTFCGTDGKSYVNYCHMYKEFCNTFGPTATVTVAKKHSGKCEVFYSYGPSHGDQSFVGDDVVQVLYLKTKIPLFSSKFETLYLSSNGFISTVEDMNTKMSIPYYQPMVAMYATDLYSDNKKGVIYYRVTDDQTILDRASIDIAFVSNSSFNASLVILITFHNVGTFSNKFSENKFQFILATDYTDSYGIFNYGRLETQGGLVGFFGSMCNFKLVSEKNTLVNETTNVGIEGRHIYKLTKSTLLCKWPTVCQLGNHTEICGCVKNCSSAHLEDLCGSDNVTYSSKCDMQKDVCEKRWNSSHEIEVKYLGKCGVLYHYGEQAGDLGFSADDGSAEFNLTNPVRIFGSMVKTLYVNTNGFLSFDHEKAAVIPDNYNKPVIHPFNLDLISSGNGSAVYFREDTRSDILSRASRDVQRKTGFLFNVTSVVIVTYSNVKEYSNQMKENTFQVVIATDSHKTYGIFNYGNLESQNAKAGFFESNCNKETFIAKEESDMLRVNSNVGMDGRQIYLLSESGNITCGDRLTCRKNETEQIVCGCIRDCSKIERAPVCGADVTYSNLCEFHKTMCEKYGPSVSPNISVSYSGSCTFLYGYGDKHQDSSFSGDDESVTLNLQTSMPLFTIRTDTLHISSNGFISINTDKNINVAIPYHQTIIVPYNKNLFSDSNNGKVYYRVTEEQGILARATTDVLKTGHVFNATKAVVITFENVVASHNRSLKHSFQLIIASDHVNSFGIFNYERLDTSGAVAGFYGSSCEYKVFIDANNSSNLVNTTNIGVQGRHVYLLTKKTQLCKYPTVCQLVNNTEICGCLSNCSLADGVKVCGSDGKTYSSECELRKVSCEKYDDNSTILVQHVGECGVLYSYGETTDFVFFADDGYVPFPLSSPMKIFGSSRNHLYVNSNGYISLSVETLAVIPDNYQNPILLPYNMDLISAGGANGAIYVRETADKDTLSRAEQDVIKRTGEPFLAKSAFVLTYDVRSYQERSKELLFQIVLVTDGFRTYGIFNYLKLDASGARAGFFENECNSVSFPSHKLFAHTLIRSTNVNSNGRFVFLLSSTASNLTCPEHLQCQRQDDGQVNCGCVTSCLDAKKNVFCGTDHSTYESNCELHKRFCEQFGVNAALNVTKAHDGDCKQRYPFGKAANDSELTGDDTSYLGKLEKEIPLFSTYKDHIYVCTNGFISFIPNSKTSVNIPGKQTVLAMYAMDLDATNRGVYYRTSSNEIILNRANEDVTRLTNEPFRSTYAIIITFDKIPMYRSSLTQSFQAVLVTDGAKTYAILNYFDLTAPNATAGFYESDCNYKIFASKETSSNLTHSTNIGVKGRYVYLLSSTVCPTNRDCVLNNKNEAVCGCIKHCQEFQTDPVCGSDGVQYKSLCEYEKFACERYGASGKPNVTVLFKGACTGLYPFGNKNGDMRFYGDEVFRTLDLKKEIPLPTRKASRIFINSNGYITMREHMNRSVIFPPELPIIAGYAIDLDSSVQGSLYIWYRQTDDPNILSRTNMDVKRVYAKDFNSTFAIVATYNEIGKYQNHKLLQTFQIIIVSDGVTTFAIYIYDRLDSNNAVTGFYENQCNNHQLSSRTDSNHLNRTTNCGVTGMHVLQLSNQSCYSPQTGLRYTKKDISNQFNFEVGVVSWPLSKENPLVTAVLLQLESGPHESNAAVFSFHSARYVSTVTVEFGYFRAGPTSSVMLLKAHMQAVLEDTEADDSLQYGVVRLLPQVGVACTERKFTKPMMAKPSIKITLHVPSKLYRGNTSIWLRNVTRDGFLTCIHNSQATAVHNINFVAVANTTNNVTEFGVFEKLLSGHASSCGKVFFERFYVRVPLVFVSHELNRTYTGHVNTWLKSVALDSFEVCTKQSNSVDLLESVNVHYMVNGFIDQCKTFQCPSYQQCKRTASGKPYCACITDCYNSKEDLVCGSDHVTYSSACALKKKSCEMYGIDARFRIEIAHFGKCIRFPFQSGKTIVNRFTKLFCQRFVLDQTNFHDNIEVQILVTPVITSLTRNDDNNTFVTWTERKSTKNFTACIRAVYPLQLHAFDWVAFQKGFETYVDGASGTLNIMIKNGAISCVPLNLTVSGDPNIFLTSTNGPRNHIYSVWLSYDPTVQVCSMSRDSTITATVNIDWLLIRNTFLPHLTDEVTVSFKSNDSLCKTIRYNEFFPILPDPNVIATAGWSNISNTPFQIWLGESNDTHLSVCQNANMSVGLEQFTVTIRVLPKLCSHGWKYAGSRCYKKQFYCETYLEARKSCEQMNSSLPLISNRSEEYFMKTQHTDKHLWLSVTDELQEGLWVDEEGSNLTYTNWLTGEPGGSTTQNCAAFSKRNETYGWDDQSCGFCNKFLCTKDANLSLRGGCDKFCFNGGTCHIVNTAQVKCECLQGFMGDRCEINLTDIPECSDYIWHNETSRKITNKIDKHSNCDARNFTSDWHRFGAATDSKLGDKCPVTEGDNQSLSFCGVKNPGWLYGGRYPENGAIVERYLHFHSFYCADDSGKVLIKDCGRYFTYKFVDFPFWSCDYGICVL